MSGEEILVILGKGPEGQNKILTLHKQAKEPKMILPEACSFVVVVLFSDGMFCSWVSINLELALPGSDHQPSVLLLIY